MLKVDKIFVSYGSFQALHGISLEVKEGEIVALLGSNGAGKTTTLKTISGQERQTSGKIEFLGKDISDTPVYERVELGLVQVPEGRRLFPYLSVEENLLAASYIKKARAKRSENLEYCYALFPKLFERKKQFAGSLSGGEQQMCAIARGLMQCPKILMLDEPSLGLAPVIVDSIFKAMVEINKEKGITILMVEQNVAFSLEIANRAYVIEVGEDVINGLSKDLLHNEEVQRAYLGI